MSDVAVEAAVEVEQLGKRFASGGQPVQVLAGLSFQVAGASSLAVVGRSGSGKSTLLNLLCGLGTPDSGRITVLGERFDAPGDGVNRTDDEARWARLRRQAIGVVFQEANLMPALSLRDNVRLRAHLAGQPGDRASQWLERLGVGAQADRFPDQVSGGQRQRAALAMVFAMNPGLILADEPTGSLDRHTAEQVADCLFSMQRHTGCPLILATHDMALAGRCDRLIDLSELFR